MTAINHAITGASLALVIQNPLIAISLSLASHFVLDAIPHFGLNDNQLKTKFFRNMLLVDILLCVVLVVLLTVSQPLGWAIACVAAFIATSPDLMWASGYFRVLKGLPEDKLNNPIKRFHSRIQHYQRPPGAIVELAWFALVGGFLSGFLF